MAHSKDLLSFKNNVVSSASWVMVTAWLLKVNPVIFLLLRRLIARTSAINMNNSAEMGQPCRMPRSTLKNCVELPLLITHELMSLYRIFIHFIKFGPKLKYFNVLKRKDHETVSKAFSKSRKIIRPGLIFSEVYSIISNMVRIFSLIHLPFM